MTLQEHREDQQTVRQYAATERRMATGKRRTVKKPARWIEWRTATGWTCYGVDHEAGDLGRF